LDALEEKLGSAAQPDKAAYSDGIHRHIRYKGRREIPLSWQIVLDKLGVHVIPESFARGAAYQLLDPEGGRSDAFIEMCELSTSATNGRAPRGGPLGDNAAISGKTIETIGFYCFYFRRTNAKPSYREERFLGERRPT
jgi:hypothetical protein